MAEFAKIIIAKGKVLGLENETDLVDKKICYTLFQFSHKGILKENFGIKSHT